MARHNGKETREDRKVARHFGKVTGEVGNINGEVGKVVWDVGKVSGEVGKVAGEVGNITREDERGSAVAEFVLVALPLFLPALLFFLSMNQASRAEMEADFLAREAVHVFTSSENDFLAHARVNKLLSEYSQIHQSRLDGARVTYSISCSDSPCIKPGGAVDLRLALEFSIANEAKGFSGNSGRFLTGENSMGPTERTAFGRARGYVDKWR